MKKILATILSLIFLFSICVGCEGNKNDGFVAVSQITYTIDGVRVFKASTKCGAFYYYDALGRRCEQSSAIISYNEAKQFNRSENNSYRIKKADEITKKGYTKTSFVVENDEEDDFYSVLSFEGRYYRIKYYGTLYSIVYVRKNKDNTIDIKDETGMTTIPNSVQYEIVALI